MTRRSLRLSQLDLHVVAVLKRHGVQAIVIGGHAINFHGGKRDPHDLDLLVGTGKAAKLRAALRELGGDVSRYPPALFGQARRQIPIKYRGYNVDLLTSIEGLSFKDASAAAVPAVVSGRTVRVIAKHHLVHSKLVAGRPRDRKDVDAL